jgi:hypothetical protein
VKISSREKINDSLVSENEEKKALKFDEIEA